MFSLGSRLRMQLQVALIGSLWLLSPASVSLAFAQTSAPVTATCKDGTTFSGQTKRGACSRHGGVQTWTSAAAGPATAPSTAATAAPSMSPPAKPLAQSTSTPAKAPTSGQVWVNTASSVYHCPGTRYYGKTKAGEYMSETAAKAKGYRPSLGKVCG
ncbi:DUF3761 domain-containing protein [Acidisoma silvae]|uniref:DUF3761 domain-containing protein n=1 Tax=Acidisoma silvae TaxID=2802396 RepID=A0A963YVX0_9PROT|nr:DUF3761 domain-containing protein [Acidisoma silvae]MCB8877332.1 DUF3761 domain-containing protein [Acidisoma silvae]